MNKVWAFLVRDYRIHRTYRFLFAMEVSAIVINVVQFYFLSRFIGQAFRADLQSYGGDYFSFALVGLAVNDYLLLPLSLFSRQVRESQLNGTLEAVLSTQTSLHTVMLSSAVYPVLWASIKGVIYIALGVALFGLNVGAVNWLAAALILILALTVFAGIGVLSASFILVFKQGDPLAFLIGGLSWVFAGVLYPVSVLPGPLKAISALMPVRYAIDGVRAAVLQNAAWGEMWPKIGMLMVLALILVPLGFATFYYANKRVRITGSLGDY